MQTHHVTEFLSRTVKHFEDSICEKLSQQKAYLIVPVSSLIAKLHPQAGGARPEGHLLIPMRSEDHVPNGAIELPHAGLYKFKGFVELPGFKGLVVPTSLANRANLEHNEFFALTQCKVYLYHV